MNAKEYNIDVTVVCKIKIRTEPQLLDKNKMPISQQRGADVEPLHLPNPHEAASVHLLTLLKNKTNPENKTNLFLH